MILENLIRNDNSPKFYQNYPRLFLGYFNGLKVDVINQLSKAGYYYYHSTLLTDSLIDDREFSKFPMITLLQEESIKLLTDVYGIDSEFWDFWNKRRDEYFEAVKIEQKMNYDSIVSLKQYADLADKKAAFGKVAIDCLFLLSNKQHEKLYRSLLKSHYFFSVGFQLYDDIKDFKEDYHKDQFNWAIYQQSKEDYYQDYKGDVSVLNKLLFVNGTGQEVMAQAILYFKKAFEIIEILKVESEWKDVILEMKQTISNYLNITRGYVKSIHKRIEIKNNINDKLVFFDFQDVKNEVIKNGLDYIKEAYLNNYSDLKHIMYLGNQEGFENKDDIHVSDIFQRAILNDCLIDITKSYNLYATDFFNLEVDYLINQRNKDFIGGWSYFPTVKEIAADIDDLGQIMQLFMKTENINFVEKYAQNVIDLAIADRTTASGGIETWIIPNKNRTVLQDKQEMFNTTKWGKGPDVEVVANFVYALKIYDSIKYSTSIKNAISYILANQNKLGFWESRWYYGNYYGTYMCLRLLKDRKDSYKSNIEIAIKYILEQQSVDGGFALLNNKKSDPLSTAYAILSLRIFFDQNHNSVKKAVDYLRINQNKNGYWEATDFIKPKAQEPYGSRTITTAIVLKALCYDK
jgi:hypothetical protein